MTQSTKYGRLSTKYGRFLTKSNKYVTLGVKDVSDKEKILTVIDKETGEIQARVKLPDRTFGKQRWFAMFQDAMIWISQQHMTGEQVNVLCNLIGRMEYDNRIIFKTKDVADAVGIHPNHVSRALKVLREKDIIYKDPNNDKIYKLNPHIGHKGTMNYGNNVVEFAKVKDNYDKQSKKSK